MPGKKKQPGNERAEAAVYIGITAAALVLSAVLMIMIAAGGEKRTSAPSASGYPQTVISASYGTPAAEKKEENPLTAVTPGKETEDTRRYEVELTDAQAGTLAGIALREDADTAEARFSAPDTLEVTAQLKRDCVLDIISDDHETAAAAARATN